jgi:hypothetical protein
VEENSEKNTSLIATETADIQAFESSFSCARANLLSPADDKICQKRIRNALKLWSAVYFCGVFSFPICCSAVSVSLRPSVP